MNLISFYHIVIIIAITMEKFFSVNDDEYLKKREEKKNW